VHITGSVGRLNTVCGRLVEAIEEVPVGVKSGLDRRVTEPFLDHLRVFSVGDEKRCRGVSEVVERTGLADGCLDRR